MRILNIEKGAPSKDILDLLNNNIIGTPGKSLVYQHQTTSDKLAFVKEPVFLSVRLGGKVIGTAAFLPRQVSWQGDEMPAFYIRYFAFRNAFRSKSDALKKLEKQSVLKTEIHEVLTGVPLDLKGKHLFYAYVDPGNIRSSRLIESFGFEQVGTFKTVFFSRFFPKRNSSVSRLKEEDKPEVLGQLRTGNRTLDFFFTENLGFKDNYFVYKEGGEIVAGVQANAEHWKVHEIPGGKNLINIVSSIPLLNKLFNKEFRFVSLEGLFVKVGHEHVVEKLLEHVLGEHQRNTAIICLDANDKLYQLFHQMNRGFIRFLSDEKEMAVVAKLNGFAKKASGQRPVYVSALDNM